MRRWRDQGMTAAHRGHVVIGMSGGVDSSVAALLLLREGYTVTGLFMKNWEEDDTEEYCAAAEDLADAQAVCDRLDIPLHTVNFSHEYWERVFSYCLTEYAAGRTPNPDVLCNKEIKFKEFLDQARRLGADLIATGHYARTDTCDGARRLLKGCDGAKDQSYFLYTLEQSALTQTLFPIGDRNKGDVRALARRAALATHDKRDSTGICFIGERRFKDFLSRYLDTQVGEIRDLNDRILGRHDGLAFYTLGQRQGLGVGGAGDAWYVAAKDVAANVLYVVQGHDHPALMSHRLRADALHWLAPAPPATPLACTAKTRYRQTDQPCLITTVRDGAAEVRFEQPQRAVTPGQAVVFYDGDVCLGGGVIRSSDARAQAA